MKFLALTCLVLCLQNAPLWAHEDRILCTSGGLSGDSVAQATELCANLTNFTPEHCHRNVTCRPYVTFCNARGYAGDNVQKAVENCQSFGRFSQENCLKNVNCN